MTDKPTRLKIKVRAAPSRAPSKPKSRSKSKPKHGLPDSVARHYERMAGEDKKRGEAFWMGWVRAKNEGWLGRIQNYQDVYAVADGCYFDPAGANRVMNFFTKKLRHYKGEWAGGPFIPMTWQREQLLVPAFGWKREGGARRFKTVFCEVPKKNGKSTLAAGIGLYMVCADNEQGSEVYLAANSRDQARKVFEPAVKMGRVSPVLNKICTFHEHITRINHAASNSFMVAISADSDTNEGHDFHGLIVDEVHVMTDREYWGALQKGGIARRQPMTWVITTAGSDMETVGYDEYQFACQVRDGEVMAWHYLPVIYEIPKAREDDWRNPELWKMANPAYGEILSYSGFEEQVREAEQKPIEVEKFKRYRLNVWVQSSNPWLPVEKWDLCLGEEPDAPWHREGIGTICAAGVDLSTTQDLTSYCLAFLDSKDLLWCRWRHYLPAENIYAKEDKDRAPYRLWAEQNWLTLTEGEVVDYQQVKRDILADAARFQMVECLFDPLNAVQLATDLTDSGVPVAMFRQGTISMEPAIKEIEGRILDGRFRHIGDPVSRWAFTNVEMVSDTGGNRKMTKTQTRHGKSRERGKTRKKIDPMVAMMMGGFRAVIAKPARRESSYRKMEDSTSV